MNKSNTMLYIITIHNDFYIAKLASAYTNHVAVTVVMKKSSYNYSG